MNSNDNTFLIGQMATFTDHSGATVSYFRRARHQCMDVIAKGKSAATRAVNRANEKGVGGSVFYAISVTEYMNNQQKFNPVCKTVNMLNPAGGFCDISAGSFGSACDPASESYHCN